MREAVAIVNVKGHAADVGKGTRLEDYHPVPSTLKFRKFVSLFRQFIRTISVHPQEDKIQAMESSGNRGRQIALAYAVSVGVWVSIALLLEWQYVVLVRMQRVQVSLADTLPMALARGFGFALLTPPIFYIVRRYTVGKRHSVRRVIGYLAGTIPFVIVFSCMRFLLLPPWDDVLRRYVQRSWPALVGLVRTGFADQIVIYFAIVVAAHAYEYFERAREEELERSELQQALAASELQALRIQLHPHFLFNTLHGISTLIDSDPKVAKAMIVRLSSLLRAALKHASSDLAPLQEEVDFIQAYLDIEKLRLGKRLVVRFAIDPATSQMLVPQLILQPLVENAIVHGVSCTREGGWIEIATQQDDGGAFEIQVRNSVGGEGRKGVGLGLQNTATRLKYLYTGGASFSFAIGHDKTATARLVLPALRSLVAPKDEDVSLEHAK
jgi:two-component system LytT family sensor kinase